MGGFIKFITSKVFFIQLAAALILTGALLYAAVKYLDTYTRHGVRTEVPDLSGYHYTEVEGIMEEAGLTPIIADSSFTPEVKPGMIIGQNPKPGSEVKPGRKVYITINTVTPPKVVLPALKDLTFRQARSRVMAYGLKIDSVQYRPAECTNCVVDVLYQGHKLNPGAEVERGKGVILVVGSGESDIKIQIPPLFGMKLENAEKHLLSKGLNTGIIHYDGSVLTKKDSSKAAVYKQIPEYAPGNTINLGRSIDLYLSVDSTKIPEFELMEYDTLQSVEQP